MSLQDHAPGWLSSAFWAALGAGAVKLADVLLEHRRLDRKSYREALSSRIEKVEEDLEHCHRRSASLQERVGRLEERLEVAQEEAAELDEENTRLLAELQDLREGETPHREG